MKTILFLALLLGGLSISQAADAPAVPAEKARDPKPLTAEQSAEYIRLVREELQVSTERNVLARLAEEHLQRAAELGALGKAEKAQWETDRAEELKDKSSNLLTNLNELTSQRLTFEIAHAPVAPTAPGNLAEKKSLSRDEFAYLTALDERLLRVRQEIATLQESARLLAAELQTNHAEEDVQRISGLVDANTFRMRQSEKEQSDIELRKLEFRALRSK